MIFLDPVKDHVAMSDKAWSFFFQFPLLALALLDCLGAPVKLALKLLIGQL